LTGNSSDDKRVSPENSQPERIIIHMFWIGVTISLIVALIFAYMDAREEFRTFSELFSKPSGTLINQTTTIIREPVGEVSMPITK
jgi:hypothetical protein